MDSNLIRSGLQLTKWAKSAKNHALLTFQQVRYVEKEPPGVKPPAKVEQIDKITMPGFVHPEKSNEEGYFTQQAKQQLEELKKRLDKPKVDDTEKKE